MGELIRCSCGTHGIELERVAYPDGEEDIILKIWVLKWYRPEETRLRDRLAALWSLLRGRRLLTDEVCLDRESLRRLHEEAGKILAQGDGGS